MRKNHKREDSFHNAVVVTGGARFLFVESFGALGFLASRNPKSIDLLATFLHKFVNIRFGIRLVQKARF